MEIIKHRINSLDEIITDVGLEIDIRDHKNTLVLSHDHPNDQCITLDNFLKNISKNQLLAINIKTTEIESELNSILLNSNITNYFTFDWTTPSLIKALTYNLTCAFRLSEYEQNIIPNCSWVWIDCFHSIWYDVNFLESLKKSGLKLCLVSPELHNRKSEVNKVKDIVSVMNIDAICTDYPSMW